MRKSCLVPQEFSPNSNKNARLSTDISNQYVQIANFLTDFLQDVQHTSDSPSQNSLPKPQSSNRLVIPCDENIENSRRRSSILKSLKAPLVIKNKSLLQKNKPIPEKTPEKQEEKKKDPEPTKPRKVVYKRFCSSVDMDTNSQELFSNASTDHQGKKEISSKTLKVYLKFPDLFI